jgi:hypothetical protein
MDGAPALATGKHAAPFPHRPAPELGASAHASVMTAHLRDRDPACGTASARLTV